MVEAQPCGQEAPISHCPPLLPTESSPGGAQDSAAARDVRSHYDSPKNSHIPSHYDVPPVRHPPSPPLRRKDR